MLKKYIAIVLSILVLAAALPVAASAAAGGTVEWLDTSKLEQGAVGIVYKAPKDVRTKILITTGSNKDTYDYPATADSAVFSLRFGNGTYKISIMEQVSGNKYKAVQSASVEVALKNQNDLYLNSIQNINWSDAELTVAKAKELTKGYKTDKEKVKAIYDYIVRNVNYDYDLAAKVTTQYIPDIDGTLTSGKAICYGYSSLFAAMVRSIGIPAKLDMGNTTYVQVYHAWNEVWLDGKWVTVDTTVDNAYVKSQKSIDWIKDASKYTAVEVY